MQTAAADLLEREALRAWIATPVAIQVSVCGAGLEPESVRGFAVSLDDVGALTIGIVDEQAPRLLALLEPGVQVAVNLTDPLNFRGRQLKGPLLAVEEPSAEAARAATQYFERFTVVLAKIGMTPQICRGLFKTGATRFVRIQPQELFDQTPGATAGDRL